jgi:peptidoglycan LD-endopeptidase LytH
MLKILAVLLIGLLVGANVVYYAMTHGDRQPPERVEHAPPIPREPSVEPAVAVAPPATKVGTPPATTAADRPAAASVATPRMLPVQAPVPTIAGLIVPVSGVSPAQLSDTFGDARDGERQHEALDIMAPAGTPVFAIADGSIEKLFDSKQGGLTIYQFEPTGRYAFYYAHLQSYAPGIAEKQAVRQGEVIGYVGSTGNADPSAPHLHFAIFALGPEKQWWKGTPVNPYPLLGPH